MPAANIPIPSHPRFQRQALTVNEVAAILGAHPVTVRNMIRREELPSIKVGGKRVVTRAALEQLLGGPIQEIRDGN